MAKVKTKISILLVIAVAAVLTGMVIWGGATTSLTVGSDNTIAVTPQKVSQVRRIGQWEFMTVVDEQIVDTVRHRTILPDERLTCIYYGILRLGIDLDKAADDWVVNNNDTVTVRLPKPGLLDDNFIDEARTKVFYERGPWGAYTKNRMYRTAAGRMRDGALTDDNLERVRKAATQRFEQLFSNLGAKEVVVTFDD